VRLGSHHDAQFDGCAGGWSLISVVTPLPPTERFEALKAHFALGRYHAAAI
jgi:hypothetical protein